MMGNIWEADKKAFRNMLRFDVVRGEDSTGVATVEKHGQNKIHLYKRTGAPDYLFNFYNDFNAKGIYTGPMAKAFIGHNRYATKGKVNDENAHPFQHGSVVGAHNGTLTSVKRLEDGDKFEVDSEAIFYNLNKYETKSVIADVWGAYALTWYDQDDDKLYVIRNKERPLCWTRRKDNDVIYWGSLKWVLEMSLAYANVEHGEIHEFPTDHLFSFDLSDPTKFKNTNWIDEGEMLGYNPPVQHHKPNRQYYQGGGYGMWSDGYYDVDYDDNKTTMNTNTGGKSNNVSPFPSSKQSSQSSTGAGLPKELQEEMKALQGKEIKFRFSGVRKGISNEEYLLAYPDDPLKGFDIRIFGSKHENWEEWKKKLHTYHFSGVVKRFVKNNVRGKKEFYLLIDLRSVKEVEKKASTALVVVNGVTMTPEEEKMSRDIIQNLNKLNEAADKVDKGIEDAKNSNFRERFYEGFRGAYLTYEEFERATESGCSGCTGPGDPDDQELIFIGHDQFLCGDCASMDFYKQQIASFL